MKNNKNDVKVKDNGKGSEKRHFVKKYYPAFCDMYGIEGAEEEQAFFTTKDEFDGLGFIFEDLEEKECHVEFSPFDLSFIGNAGKNIIYVMHVRDDLTSFHVNSIIKDLSDSDVRELMKWYPEWKSENMKV